jgi:hypothetical protein
LLGAQGECKNDSVVKFFQDIWPKEKEMKNMKNTRSFLYLLACRDAKYFKKIYGVIGNYLSNNSKPDFICSYRFLLGTQGECKKPSQKALLIFPSFITDLESRCFSTHFG